MRHSDARRPVQKLKKDLDAPLGVEPKQSADLADKRTADQMDLIARREINGSADNAMVIRPRAKTLDKSGRDRARRLPCRNQMRNADCPVDRSPSVARKIKSNKKIARK